MKSLLLLALGLATAAFARAADYSFTEPFKQSAAFDARGEVSLENVNGDIVIRTWDRNEILVEGVKAAKTDEELKRIELSVDLSPARAAIKVRLPKRSGGLFGGDTIRASVRFALTVPATATLAKIDSVNSTVTIDGVRGPVRVSSVNGRLAIAGISADARVHTVNGTIRASVAQTVADQKLNFETVNGTITVELPRDAGARLRASVVNGHIDCDLPITLAGGKHRHSLDGTLGDGRASLSAEAVNGSIHFKSP